MKSKFWSLCLSIILAVGIWVYVITVVSPESRDTFENIPVQLQSQTLLDERGLVITGVSHSAVSLQLFGNRSDLIQLDSGNIRVFADVSKIYEPGVHDVSYTVSYPGSIPNGAIEIQSRFPDTIQVSVEKRTTKKLDVTVDYQGAVPEGYLVDKANIQLSTKAIHISGAQSFLDKVAGAKIIVDLTNKTESISGLYSVVLIDENKNQIVNNSISCDVNNIHVNLKIAQFKDVPVVFTPLYNNSGATAENTSIVPSQSTVQIVGHKNLLADIDSIDLGTIDLSRQLSDIVLTLPTNLPDGVDGPEFVDVEIKFNGLTFKKLIVTNFEKVNVPQGMDVTFQQSSLTVTIRGTQEELEAIDENHITVEVDFSAAQVGQLEEMPVKILIDAPAQSNVGAVYTEESDSVRAKLKRA